MWHPGTGGYPTAQCNHLVDQNRNPTYGHGTSLFGRGTGNGGTSVPSVNHKFCRMHQTFTGKTGIIIQHLAIILHESSHKGLSTLKEGERESELFFDICRCWMWTLNWILCELIRKRCHFRFHFRPQCKRNRRSNIWKWRCNNFSYFWVLLSDWVIRRVTWNNNSDT